MSSAVPSTAQVLYQGVPSTSQADVEKQEDANKQEDASQYQHANVVKQFLDGWIGALNSGTVVSTLLTGVATAFFIHIQEQLKFSEPHEPSPTPSTTPPSNAPTTPTPAPAAAHALLIFAYASILANCTAAIVSFYLANRLLYIPMQIANDVFSIPNNDHTDITNLVVYVNARVKWNTWRKSRIYWVFTAFVGFFSVFIELALYGYIYETNSATRIAIGILTAMGAIPLLYFLWTILERIWK